jgi:hypothetical protein
VPGLLPILGGMSRRTTVICAACAPTTTSGCLISPDHLIVPFQTRKAGDSGVSR